MIYLREKEVVQRDLRSVDGRGSSRVFSRRNLLEFSVALKLRELQIPAQLIRTLLKALRELEAHLAAELPGFAMPDSLRSSTSPDLRLVIAWSRLQSRRGSIGSRWPESSFGCTGRELR